MGTSERGDTDLFKVSRVWGRDEALDVEENVDEEEEDGEEEEYKEEK